MEQVRWARNLARTLLADALPTRWAHTQGVGRSAESIAPIVGADADLLSCAAWLHDIGYAAGIAKTGFHPLDGARYLRDIEGAEDRLCRLVANHSLAIIEARNRGLSVQLSNEFPIIDGLLSEALTYCDMTTNPRGDKTGVDARLDEVTVRYSASHVVARSITEARPQLSRIVASISAILQSQP